MTPQELYDRVDEEYNKHRKRCYDGDEYTNVQYHAGAMEAYGSMLMLLLQCEEVIAE
jgi:hypothetical protein